MQLKSIIVDVGGLRYMVDRLDIQSGVGRRMLLASELMTTKEEVAMQLRLYARGLTMLGESVTKGSVAYLEDASVESVKVGGDELREAEGIAERHIDGISRGIFTPCPGGACERCDYDEICRWKR